jgi:hypothetical protein
VAILLITIEFVFLPLPGIQSDEALFTKPFLHGAPIEYAVTLGAARVPVMLLDYIGGLKTWLYWPVFRIWNPGLWSIRLPVCISSVGTVLMFGLLVRGIAGYWVAVGSMVLLATNASFVLTNEFDWGPVALLLAGTLGFISLCCAFARTGKITSLGAAFLVAGIMVWYKAIFAFPLAGMLFASLAVFTRQLRRHATVRHIAVAVAAFLIRRDSQGFRLCRSHHRRREVDHAASDVER